MIITDNLFHCDLHPGNMRFKEDPQVCTHLGHVGHRVAAMHIQSKHRQPCVPIVLAGQQSAAMLLCLGFFASTHDANISGHTCPVFYTRQTSVAMYPITHIRSDVPPVCKVNICSHACPVHIGCTHPQSRVPFTRTNSGYIPRLYAGKRQHWNSIRKEIMHSIVFVLGCRVIFSSH